MSFLLQRRHQCRILLCNFGARITLAVSLSLCASGSFALGLSSVPTKLFGITLGSVVKIDPKQNDADVTKLPAKAFRGIKRFAGAGVHFYIEPVSAHERFPYIEKKVTPEDTEYVTSYRLYLLPLIPSKIKTFDELNEAVLDWEVATINWDMLDPKIDALKLEGPERKSADRDSYFWAANLCNTFEAEFNVKPEIVNMFEYLYTCKFIQEGRMFEIDGGRYGRRVSLRYSKEEFDKKNDDVGKRLRQLEAQELLR